ncbi:prepilin-type N-terminal cleavage/methylation domain-containing protein [Pseudomonas sp. GD03860]|uniref:type II secretion system protein GspJ n=1 Tax=Pseudomonas TaxID=286 RepID=UPI002363D603|nr:MULTISPECIES: type II secretion system protein GspJ [Pseudomonas]MDD2058607.1 prepilin-type N-terminal cleavage/methylation domain-containing protein [Pseudomonas putida]MDH0640796.1 prepilin-type N-terminal cleavage/methylation domain-containing protein [Pseudomonas sp. GD03860]
MSRQQGFTLLELVIAMAIFALLGLACWRLFDGVVRVERSTSAHEQALRGLQRALAVIERDAVQVNRHPLVLEQGVLQLQRGNWRNPLDHPRSELQNVSYHLDQGTLWRVSASVEQPLVQRQKLLTEVSELSWRLHDGQTGWRTHWPVAATAPPQALEVVLSTGRFEQIRRVILLPGHAP